MAQKAFGSIKQKHKTKHIKCMILFIRNTKNRQIYTGKVGLAA